MESPHLLSETRRVICFPRFKKSLVRVRYLIVLVGAHLLAREPRQVETFPEVVPGPGVVMTFVRREEARVDADLQGTTTKLEIAFKLAIERAV